MKILKRSSGMGFLIDGKQDMIRQASTVRSIVPNSHAKANPVAFREASVSCLDVLDLCGAVMT